MLHFPPYRVKCVRQIGLSFHQANNLCFDSGYKLLYVSTRIAQPKYCLHHQVQRNWSNNTLISGFGVLDNFQVHFCLFNRPAINYYNPLRYVLTQLKFGRHYVFRVKRKNLKSAVILTQRLSAATKRLR